MKENLDKIKTNIDVLSKDDKNIRVKVSNHNGEDTLLFSYTKDGTRVRVLNNDANDYELINLREHVLRKKNGALKDMLCVLDKGVIAYINYSGKNKIKTKEGDYSIFSNFDRELGMIFVIGDKKLSFKLLYNKEENKYTFKKVDMQIIDIL